MSSAFKRYKRALNVRFPFVFFVFFVVVFCSACPP